MSDTLATRAGILTRAQLHAIGWTSAQLEQAVATGRLIRVRPGWFAGEPVDPEVLAAVKAYGCSSCFSALRLHGVWVPEGRGAHVRLPRHRQRRRRAGEPKRCRPFGVQPPVASAIDSLEVAFRCVLRCGSREEIVVVIDSILQRRLASRHTLEDWMDDAPFAVRALAALADGNAESGTESMVRFRLWRRRLATRIQVRVMEGIRVDLLIGDRLIIECDSREHHTEAGAYESDRRRDRRLIARGFIVLRLTYRQIHDEWPEIEREILAIVRRGDHRWPRQRKNRG
ncbi:type IV toxin-antitoxin system AbiEi family antitoxin domain-containing protein [Agrococcus sp. ProA11]|uniref:type IV toxin-antitoxin system AbiEi family antitoxin domain-containing protein n=1 Tax=Agrococcus chionoecetis TaxID=3153752 RepID=UPI0032602483